ncbi:lipid-A-disaccharide synthase [Candidatus Erwinia haradaeae]|uniref:Lipid-A-disaccharide synthase n=1 Tax=Candidatus Erwinia haradaeae TaxID=1922217 RepID=A0A451D208_9GAMM|nr:lipid-A-disaccharide synthase [Candidatus Erwinia haradaeae]VFP79649.1 Lipid-A-disaccharide synthase [Candidatus Erwinia haradaeae]
MFDSSLTIALVAGERSGDILGAGLILALKEKNPNINFIGIAGPLMRLAGCVALYNMEELSVMGIIEVIGRLKRILYIRREFLRRLMILNPDVFIGIDSPDFNLMIERYLKRNGIHTVHYVSPSLWAWRKRRILKISRSVDLVLLLFPFEKDFYDRFNISCQFIGHSLADVMPLIPDKLSIRQELGINPQALCLALLPGSRSTEVYMLSEIFLKTALILREKYPKLEIIVPFVDSQCRAQFEAIKSLVSPDLFIRCVNGQSRQVMQASDVALLASGTAALECMLAKCPMVVAYRMKAITFWIVKRLIKIDYVSLPNILAGSYLVPELLQNECKPLRLAAELEPFLSKKQSFSSLLNTFSDLHQKICKNANEKAAEAVLNLCKK